MTHFWNVTPKEAIEIQKKLKDKVIVEPLKKDIKYIAGADISLNRFENDLFAGILIFSYPDLVLVEEVFVKTKTDFPYIPGLLSFREIPALLEVWKKVKIKPDVIMVDGQGIAHPRRLGIASHLGVLLDIPTIGVAKSILFGKVDKDALYDYDEQIGRVLHTKKNAKPLIISPGHKINIRDSVKIVKSTIRGYRLPEPTRQAHIAVNTFRKIK